jgi:hypothetical protein
MPITHCKLTLRRWKLVRSMSYPTGLVEEAVIMCEALDGGRTVDMTRLARGRRAKRLRIRCGRARRRTHHPCSCLPWRHLCYLRKEFLRCPNVELDEARRQALQQVARRKRVPMRQLLERAVDEFIKRAEDEELLESSSRTAQATGLREKDSVTIVRDSRKRRGNNRTR